jgi:hypothetical protein
VGAQNGLSAGIGPPFLNLGLVAEPGHDFGPHDNLPLTELPFGSRYAIQDYAGQYVYQLNVRVAYQKAAGWSGRHGHFDAQRPQLSWLRGGGFKY